MKLLTAKADRINEDFIGTLSDDEIQTSDMNKDESIEDYEYYVGLNLKTSKSQRLASLEKYT